ncbi:glycosyltransferase family 4 protein [Arthrospira platensis FACHB-439]|uniref:glycosyltransferase family 4 protein n=1 Tax=Limnospira platensis TaxID=118562 RepID=UPI001688C87D|nr:glycosyltransferase family 4 protein [Arthrospira platensis FACHB-439]
MRILIYSYNYYPEPIGIAPLMTELAEGLVKRGHQVRVVTGMPNYPERRVYPEYQGKFYVTEQRNGVEIQRSFIWIKGPKPGLKARLMLDGSFITTSIWQAFKGWKPDVIFATIPPLLVSLPVALYATIRRCPIVLNLQDIVSEAAMRVKLVEGDSFVLKTARKVEELSYKNVSRVSVIAEGFRDNLLQQGVPDDKIAYIPNWVDTKFIHPLPKENNPFREAHGLTDKFVVLYSGNIALTQGMDTVIKAAAKLQHISDIAFVIVGESKALANLQELCKVHQADNVLLRPFEPREKLPEMLAAADVGLVVQKRDVTAFNLPSKIPVILASGRAIVASVPDTGTAKVAVVKSGAGVVVPPEDPQAMADAVLKLYGDRHLVEALGKQGRKFAEAEFSFDLALSKYEALFTEVSNSR